METNSKNIISEINIEYKSIHRHNPETHLSRINSPEKLHKLFREYMTLKNFQLHYKEYVVVAYLNYSLSLNGVLTHSIGGAASSVIDIKQIIAVALKTNSSVLALCHNHPSGNLKPSNNDIRITNKLNQACNYFEIQLIDHIVISPNEGFRTIMHNKEH